MPVLLSFGHGYSAEAVARLVMARGWRVIGTTRSPARAEEIRATGAEALVWGVDDMTPALDGATHILTSAEPGTGGDPVLASWGAQIAARAAQYDWVGYLSTTGVYGDHQGAWVDEESELRPSGPRNHARVAAEAAWRAIPDLPVHIFRLAGIYGPGRGPFAKVQNGTARRIVKENHVFGRIHVEDIAQVVLASIDKPHAGRVYNVADDLPAAGHLVVEEAARLLGVTPPPLEDYASAEMTPMARSFYADSRRVKNTRLHEELGVTLHYPDYKAGLAAIKAAEGL